MLLKSSMYLNLLYISIIMFVKVYVFNRIRTRQLIHELNFYLKKFDYSLSSEQIKRIHFYTIQSCITNNWFCSLRGKSADSVEIEQALYLGSITPFLDDLVDSTSFSSSQILKILTNENDEKSCIILIVNYLYQKIKLQNNEEFQCHFYHALKAQDASLKQLTNEKLNNDELFEITKSKGSSWTLLYRIVLKNKLKPGEENAIFSLGTLLQMTNDVFDVYKDYKNGQQSIYTNSKNLEPLAIQFAQLCRKMIGQFMELDYSFKQKKKSLMQIMLVIARGIVCHEQLLQCQKKTSNRFQIELYSREELICDMEKTGNILKSLKICFDYLNHSCFRSKHE